MPLRFDLGPYEKLYIGKSVLTNHHDRTQFVIDGETPILRAKDVLDSERAVSSAEKLYRCVQQMYLEEDTAKYQGSYLALAAKTASENPALYNELKSADELIVAGQHYKALKVLKKLIGREAFGRKAEPDVSAQRVSSGGG